MTKHDEYIEVLSIIWLNLIYFEVLTRLLIIWFRYYLNVCFENEKQEIIFDEGLKLLNVFRLWLILDSSSIRIRFHASK